MAQARIAGLVGREKLVVVSTVHELRERATRAPGNVVIVCEPRDADGVLTAPLLRELCEQCPALALIGFCPRAALSTDILAMANAGIDVLVQEGVDDEGIALQSAYQESIESRAARQVLVAVKGAIPDPLSPLARYCLRFPREDHSVAGLSRALGVDRKTLLNYSHRAHFMAPSALAMWCRLLLAAALLEATRAPVERIADTLDFPSPSAFRNLCHRHAQQKPSEWRNANGLALATAAFRRALGA